MVATEAGGTHPTGMHSCFDGFFSSNKNRYLNYCHVYQVALDILETLVRSSPVPLSSALMNEAFPAAVQCTLHTDDSSSQQVRNKFRRMNQNEIFNNILIHFKRKLLILADLFHVIREIDYNFIVSFSLTEWR